MQCSQCGFDNKSNATSCQQCNSILAASYTAQEAPRFCSHCGSKNQKDSAFCKKCGQKLPQLARHSHGEYSAAEPSPMPPKGSEAKPVVASPTRDKHATSRPPSIEAIKTGFPLRTVLFITVCILALLAGGYWMQRTPMEVVSPVTTRSEPPAMAEAYRSSQAISKLDDQPIPDPPTPNLDPPMPTPKVQTEDKKTSIDQADSSNSSSARQIISPPAPKQNEPPREVQKTKEASASRDVMRAQKSPPKADQLENWLESLRSEVAVCQSKGIFERIICIEKAKWKYCAPDRWDSVQDCAAKAN